MKWVMVLILFFSVIIGAFGVGLLVTNGGDKELSLVVLEQVENINNISTEKREFKSKPDWKDLLFYFVSILSISYVLGVILLKLSRDFGDTNEKNIS